MIINISNVEINGITYKRRLHVKNMSIQYELNSIAILADIEYYNDEGTFGLNCFTSTTINPRTGNLYFTQGQPVVMMVDNNTKVNPANGDYVANDTEGAIGEYDWTRNHLNNLDVLVGLGITSMERDFIPMSINRAIAAGRLTY